MPYMSKEKRRAADTVRRGAPRKCGTGGCQGMAIGRANTCKKCTSHNNRKYKFGITRDDFEMMLVRQDGRCGICGNMDSGPTAWHVDHDHVTGHIRKLLCMCCNTMLGQAKDNSIILRKGADYLDAHSSRS